MDECIGRKQRATTSKAQAPSSNSTRQQTLNFDNITIANTAVERSFPLYANGKTRHQRC